MADILIVDDDNHFRKMLRMVLERDGHKVIEACNGQEGVRRYQETPVDLVITDLIMPKKEGLETIRELTAKFPGIKIIAISGGGRTGPDNYLHMAKMFGARRTLTKPFKHSELINAVEEFLH